MNPLDWLPGLRTLAKALVLPPAAPLLVAIAGLLLATRAPRTGRALAWLGVLAMYALCTPFVAGWLARPFEQPVFEPERATDAGAVVILGGGIRRDAAEYGGETLGRLTAERVRYGARVAKVTGLPVLVAGGTPSYATHSEASLMRNALRDEYGVSVRWVEDRSRNTRENAIHAGALLRSAGIRKVVLVAHAFDIPRAEREFTAVGIEVVAAPTGLPSRGPLVAMDFLPSLGALQSSYHALYELLALAVWVAPAVTATAPAG